MGEEVATQGWVRQYFQEFRLMIEMRIEDHVSNEVKKLEVTLKKATESENVRNEVKKLEMTLKKATESENNVKGEVKRLEMKLEKVTKIEDVENDVRHLEARVNKVAQIDEKLKREVRELEMKFNQVAVASDNDMRLPVDVADLRRIFEASEQARSGLDKIVLELHAWKDHVSPQLRDFEDRISEITARTDSVEVTSQMMATPVQNVEPVASVGASNENVKPTRMGRADTPDSHTTMNTEMAEELSSKSQRQIKQEFYRLGESVYESSLFVFSKWTPYSEDSIAIVFGVIISVAMQLSILLLINKIAIGDPFNWQFDAWDWRIEHAHNKQNMFDVQYVSLARAFCDSYAMPFLLEQPIQDITIYTKPFVGIDFVPQGLCMVMIILVIWILDIVKEICDATRMALALGAIERVQYAGVRLELQNRSGDFYLGAMGSKRKAWAIFICLLRLFVGGYLCITGCYWLAQTINIEELLLNAVSLTFIVHIDEAVAYLLVTEEVKWIINNIQPLVGPRWVSHRKRLNHFMVPGFAIVLGGSLWLIFVVALVKPYLDNLQDVRRLLCGGFKDFVFQIDETSGLIQIEVLSEDVPSFFHPLATVSQNTGVTPPAHYQESGI